jgi:hypothetical protein
MPLRHSPWHAPRRTLEVGEYVPPRTLEVEEYVPLRTLEVGGHGLQRSRPPEQWSAGPPN